MSILLQRAMMQFPSAASFTDPTDLGSKLVVWLDFTDTSNMNTALDGSGSAPGNGDTVRRVNDKSGNANHMGNATGFGTYVSATTLVDFSDTDNLKPAPISALTGLTADMAVFSVLNPQTESAWMMAGIIGNSGAALCLAQNGNAAAPNLLFGSGITIYDDEVLLSSPDRNAVHDSFTNAWSSVEVYGADMSTSGYDTNLSPFYYTGSGLGFGALAKHWILTTNTLTAGEQSDLRAWLAAQKP